MHKPSAIVIKLDSVTGLQTSRILDKYGIPVIGIADNPNSFCCKTNSCKQVLTANTSNYELIATLIRLGKKLGEKSVLFPCSDDSVLAVSIHREELIDFYEFVLPDHETIDMLMDKVKLYNYLKRGGFPLPQTFIVTDKSDFNEIINHVKYPFIVKPPRVSPLWFNYFRDKALKINNLQEFNAIYDNCVGVTNTFIIQEWIDGRDSSIYQYYYYFDKKHKQIINYTSRKLRQWRIETGDACLAEECHSDPVPRVLIDIFTKINFKGLTSLEIKIDETSGSYFIIEPDVGRPNTSIGLVEASGVPILYSMYCDALDMPMPTNTQRKDGRMKWISLRRDLLSSVVYYHKGQLSFKDWLKSIKGVNTFSVISAHDPLPSLLDGFEFIKNMLISAIRKMINTLNTML